MLAFKDLKFPGMSYEAEMLYLQFDDRLQISYTCTPIWWWAFDMSERPSKGAYVSSQMVTHGILLVTNRFDWVGTGISDSGLSIFTLQSTW